MTLERVFVGLGSNEGDRLRNFEEALRRLRAVDGVRAVNGPALLYANPALLPASDARPQPPYLNTVVELATKLSPQALLAELLRIECAMGRLRRARWAPRVIDLDLLLYGARTIDEPGLRVPHPELARRDFALVPLAALAPELPIPPHRQTARALASMLRVRA